MSDLLSLEDFEGIKLSPNLSPFEILLQVAEVAAKKFDIISNNHKNAKPMMKSKPAITKHRNGEQKLMSSAIKALSEIYNHNDDVKTKSDEALTHEDLIIGNAEKEVSYFQVRMSDLLSLEDFEGIKLSPNLSPFEILLQVAEVAAKKFDIISNNHKNAKPMMKSKPAITKHRNGEQKLMSSAIKALSKIYNHNDDVKTKSDEALTHEDLIIERQQLVKESMIDESLAETTNLKRKLKDIMSNEEWIETMKNKKNKKRDDRNPPLLSLPEEFEREITKKCRGTKPDQINLVIQKPLYCTDVSTGHGRISIPCSQVESFEFLEDNEITRLRQEQAIKVPLIHKPRKNGMSLPLTETLLEFRQWNLHKSKDDPHKVNPQYLLRTNWNKVVLEDELKKGDMIQIWAFRNSQHKLCMALVRVESEEEEQQFNGSTKE